MVWSVPVPVPVPAPCGGLNQRIRRSDAAVWALLIFLCRGRHGLQCFARNLETSRTISRWPLYVLVCTGCINSEPGHLRTNLMIYFFVDIKLLFIHASSTAVAMARPLFLPLWSRLSHCCGILCKGIRGPQRIDTTHYSQHHHRDNFFDFR